MRRNENISMPNRVKFSLETILLVIFFGTAYVPFYPFHSGDSYAPEYLRVVKYIALLCAVILALSKFDLRQEKSIGAIFCLAYVILSVSNKGMGLGAFSSKLFYVLAAIALFLTPVYQGMEKLFESRFQLYLAISCFFSIALLLFFPDRIVWRGDLKIGWPSISGFLESTNRFGFLLVLGLCFSYGRKGILQFLLGALYMAVIPFTGSLGATLSALFVVTFSSMWTLANDRYNVLQYCKYVAHLFFLLLFFYFVFVDSTLFNQIILGSSKTSNSIQNRLAIVERVMSLRGGDVSNYLFGWRGLGDTDSFVVNVFQNGGLLSFGLFLGFIFTVGRTLLLEVKTSSVTPYLIALVISLELLYNNSFWNFPFLLVALLMISIFIVQPSSVWREAASVFRN